MVGSPRWSPGRLTQAAPGGGSPSPKLMVLGVQVSLTQVLPLTSTADNLGVGEGGGEGEGEVARPARAFLMGTSNHSRSCRVIVFKCFKHQRLYPMSMRIPNV